MALRMRSFTIVANEEKRKISFLPTRDVHSTENMVGVLFPNWAIPSKFAYGLCPYEKR